MTSAATLVSHDIWALSLGDEVQVDVGMLPHLARLAPEAVRRVDV
eukprot:CAMPEP_0197881630 /NCGR_PEP_ID=MMETSP1439-20131203/9056_1 /TAXON_ID=66791 /ORGANISM="Gonyaulax spinifera, Strain CCMP409" /LENGTH=44 /DNA_ID= /DNA_START= /DNA_END= /DNA_ORIENTATION=